MSGTQWNYLATTLLPLIVLLIIAATGWLKADAAEKRSKTATRTNNDLIDVAHDNQKRMGTVERALNGEVPPPNPATNQPAIPPKTVT